MLISPFGVFGLEPITINDIGLNNLLEKIFPDKIKYSFLVGAGISMDPPSNLPSARMMVKTLLGTYAPEEEVDEILNHPHMRYEFIVDIIQKFFDKKLEFLDYLELATSPNPIHIFLAQMIMKMNFVMTTNFDYLIEYALKPYCFKNSQPKPILTREDYITAVNPLPFNAKGNWPIYKLHGAKKDIFANKEMSNTLITTLTTLGKNKEEGKTFDIEPYKKPAIRAITKDTILIIIGYSGSDDFDIGPFLKEIIDLKGIIWIEHTLFESPEIIKIQEITSLEENQENNPKHITLLREINKKHDLPIYNIQTNTSWFIQNFLYTHLTDDKKKFYLYLEPRSKPIEKFDLWFRNKGVSIAQQEKYKFASSLFIDLNEYKHALHCCEQGFKVSNEVNDIKNKIYFLNAYGLVYNQIGNQQEAIKYFNECLSLLEHFNDSETKVRLLLNIGTSNYGTGNYDSALTYYLQALKNEPQSLFEQAELLNAIGGIYKIKGQTQNAYKNFKEAVSISEKIGDLGRKTTFLYNLGTVERTLGNIQNAINLFEESGKIAVELGDKLTKIDCLIGLGECNDTYGLIEKSYSYFNEALNLTKEMEDLEGKSRVLNFIGQLFSRKGEYKLALDNFKSSLEIEEKLNNLDRIATRKNNIGLMYSNLNEIQKA